MEDTEDVNVQFTFNPVITLSMEGRDGGAADSFTISDLAPGTKKNSNEVDVKVSTNNNSGYLLSATVGDASNNSSDLKQDGGVGVFSSVAVGEKTAELGDNEWGFSVDGGSNYSGLPLYSGTGVELLYSRWSTAGDTVRFLIGAKAASTQLSGDYLNTINFTAVVNVATMSMQNYTTEQCAAEAVRMPVLLTDDRDGQIYTARYIDSTDNGVNDGNCWMTQNLRLAGGTTIDSDDSNLETGKIYTLPVSTGGTGESAWTNDYVNAYMHEPTAAELTSLSSKGIRAVEAGYYYNYAAATAGTITGSSNSTDATYDICPKGWRLPTGKSGGEQQNLTPAGFQTWNKTYSHSNINDSTTAGKGAFLPVAAGFYSSGALYYLGSLGYWWSSSTYNSSGRYNLNYRPSDGLRSGDFSNRYYGYSIRCILSS